jgi:hypothetical protein
LLVIERQHNGINEEPIDAEQCPPGALALGLEQSDLLLVQAPKPLIILTEEQDFFDQLGSLEAFERLRHVYRLLGAEENLAYYAGRRDHGFWPDARQSMYAFFNQQAGVEAPASSLSWSSRNTRRCSAPRPGKPRIWRACEPCPASRMSARGG